MATSSSGGNSFKTLIRLGMWAVVIWAMIKTGLMESLLHSLSSAVATIKAQQTGGG